jgi:hypothetical protein
MGVLKVNVGTPSVPDWRNIGCGGAATTTFTDDFNRTDSTSSVSNASWVTWTTDTANASLYVWGIRSGNAYANGPSFSGEPNILYYDVGSTDYDFTATYTGANGKDSWNGLVFSMDTASGGSMRIWAANGIGGFNNGGGTGLVQTGFPSIVTGDVLRIVCSGMSIELFLNGVSVSTITNTWATTGGATRVGLFANNGDTGGQWDNVTIIGGTTTTGRLKLRLPDGTWVREKCAGDTVTSRPLKLWDGTTWQTVACLVPA